MGRVSKKLLLLISLIVITANTAVSCGNPTKEVSAENVQNVEVVEEPKLDNSDYLALEDDPNAVDAVEIQNRVQSWNFVSDDGSKVAYLTFDDGPSTIVTGEILDILKENDIKATFFVLGSSIEKGVTQKEMLKRIVEEGHAVGNHGYTHDYNLLYPNGKVDTIAFMEDMNSSLDVMKSVLGKDFNTRVIRFPGGHSSWKTTDIDQVLAENNLAFVDWNALNGDSEGRTLTADEAFEKLKKSVEDMETNNDHLVVLMHDTNVNKSNPEYLKRAIEYLKSEGYIFKTLK